MYNLLNTVGFFGLNLDWNSDTTKICLISIQAVIVLLFVILIICLIVRKRKKKVVVEETAVTEAQPVVVERVIERPVIVERVVEKPVIVGTERVVTGTITEESAEAGRLRYDKSFTARLIQSNDETKHWYTEIKNELLSYKKVKSRMSWKRETYKIGTQIVAMLVYRGKTLCVFFPLKPANYGEEYRLEDASDAAAYQETPALLRIKNDRRVKIARELIQTIMEQNKASRNLKYVTEDFYVPYEGVVELINKGLIKREIRTSADEAVFERGDDEE